jgi:trehalose 6-phosphate synthase/phosphatase
MSSGLVIVSNRLPVSVKKVDGKLEFFPSIGGLATGLAHYAKDSRNKWIGWPGIPSDDLTDKQRQKIATELQKHNCYPIFLTKKQIDDYYNGYCNRLLWPLFHDIKVSKSAWDKETDYWKAYKRINELFAKCVIALSDEENVVWVHDYQLLLLPSLLRKERPDGRIGFFLHIPFPEPKHFTKLADAEAIIAGMLGSGLIGFHTESYVKNFLATVEHHDLGVTLPRKVLLGTRSIRVLDFPMGIDYEKYAKARESTDVEQELVKLKKAYSGRKVILTVDRLDPSKGLVERAKAYKALLEQNPKIHEKVTMIMIVVPSRTEIAEYKNLKQKLEKIISEVNDTFGSLTWLPIVYRYEALPFHKVTALYRLADVAFITPLRDGMNLVAKEYLASKPSHQGVLVLSHTAGAAQELKEAVMVDPKQQETVVLGLKKALAMPTKEFRRRVQHMQAHLEKANVHTWSKGFMKSLSQNVQLSSTKLVTASLSPAKQQFVAAEFKKAANPLLLLDYDGVLEPFHRNPSDAKPTPRLKKILRKLSKRANIVIISGRAKADLESWLGDLPVSLVAEHGIYTKKADATRWLTSHYDTPKDWQKIITPILQKFAGKAPGSFVEAKSSSLVWHFRKTSPYYAQKYLIILKRALKSYVKKNNLEMHQGNKILEIRPRGISKGTSTMAWLNNVSPDFILAIGDDYTDEDMFTSLDTDAHTIKVGRGRTAARYRLNNVDSVLDFLEKLAKT